jgi:hypothetical protein
MSIPGVGASIAGQVAQEATVSLCGRFVNLFQNRFAAVSALTISSIVGITIGFFCGSMLLCASKSLTKKMFPRMEERERCRKAVRLIVWAAAFVTLNVIVSKCLKLPLSRLASAGISIGGGSLGFLGLEFVLTRKWFSKF